MYSYEIDAELKRINFLVSRQFYFEICRSPQVSITSNGLNRHAWTSDGYIWDFELEKEN